MIERERLVKWIYLVAMMQAALPRIAMADVLVLQDGGRMETVGSWQVEGPLVVFTLPSGRLSSIRLAAVDLEASYQAASERIVPPARPQPVRSSKPVMVLTDEDIPRAVDRASEDGADGSAPPGRRSPAGLVVDVWAEVERDEIDGIEIIGWLENRGSEAEEVYAVVVELRDRAGEPIEKATATLEESFIEPRRSTKFRAVFRDVDEERGRPRFEIDSSSERGRGRS